MIKCWEEKLCSTICSLIFPVYWNTAAALGLELLLEFKAHTHTMGRGGGGWGLPAVIAQDVKEAHLWRGVKVVWPQ